MLDILLLQSTPSTNQIAFKKALEGASQGFSVIAATQTSGRGRLGKSWQSVTGKGLYCSIVLRPDVPFTEFPKLTMVSGLAVAEALEDVTGIDFGLKWPNDIYRNLKKCCGILCESSPPTSEDTRGFAIVGVGVNLTTTLDDFEKEVRTTATSLLLETGCVFDRDEVFQIIRKRILANLAEFEKEGFPPLLQRWKEKDVLIGKKLEWVTNNNEIIQGISKGPDSSGQLIVTDEDGVEHFVLSGDISLARQL
jgi:BirA family transcriptional regulator, biotin operon repressor / biotin---[acetyl-CoA-carboxylase] ligase